MGYPALQTRSPIYPGGDGGKGGDGGDGGDGGGAAGRYTTIRDKKPTFLGKSAMITLRSVIRDQDNINFVVFFGSH